MQIIKLRNGAEEAASLVMVTMMSFNRLVEEKPIVAYELVTLCRDPNHQLFGKTGDDLAALSLVQKSSDGYIVHNSVRNIVLSAAEGDGFDMQFVSPVAAQ